MRIGVLSILLLFNLVLQSTVFQYLSILSIKPNSAILIIVSYAILRGDIEGSILGFFCGLLQDIFFGRMLGFYALLGMLVGFFCGKPFKDYYRENLLMPLALVALSSFLYEFAFYFISFLFRGKLDLPYYMGKIIIPQTLYSTLLSIPAYKLLYWMNEKIENHEKSGRKLF